MSDHTAADPGELANAAEEFNQVGGAIRFLKNDLEGAVAEYGQEGSGQMAQALKLNYAPGEEVALQFLDLFHELFLEKGNRLLNVGRVLADTDSDASILVSRRDETD